MKIVSKLARLEVQKTHCCLKLTTVTFKNDMPIISTAIWHGIHCHSALPYTGDDSEQQTTGESDKILSKKKVLSGEKELLFFGVNVNVLKRTSLQALWNMLQHLKHWQRAVLSSINNKKGFLNFIRGITFYPIILSNEI